PDQARRTLPKGFTTKSIATISVTSCVSSSKPRMKCANEGKPPASSCGRDSPGTGRQTPSRLALPHWFVRDRGAGPGRYCGQRFAEQKERRPPKFRSA